MSMGIVLLPLGPLSHKSPYGLKERDPWQMPSKGTNSVVGLDPLFWRLQDRLSSLMSGRQHDPSVAFSALLEVGTGVAGREVGHEQTWFAWHLFKCSCPVICLIPVVAL